MHPTKRFLLRKLLAPISRSTFEPEHTARGTAIGLAFAFTPTIGIQMPLVLFTWMLFKKLRPTWEFNLLVALAWTWVTNIFTLGPIYYLFLVTGRIVLGRWDRLASFNTFQEKLSTSLNADIGIFDTLWVYIVNMFNQFGLPLFIGSLPWAILFSWLGYRWSLSFITYIKIKRELRRTKEQIITKI
jgi:uncharacterized protein (DUF2062 family)